MQQPTTTTTTTPEQAAGVLHIWHEINGLDLDLSADGSLTIRATGPDSDGIITLDSRAALGLMMFFTFPVVDKVIIEADAINQARREAATLAEIEASRQRDADLAAKRAALPAAGQDHPAPAERFAHDPQLAAGYAAGLELGRRVADELRGE